MNQISDQEGEKICEEWRLSEWTIMDVSNTFEGGNHLSIMKFMIGSNIRLEKGVKNQDYLNGPWTAP